jgi:hypothetical protein
MCCIELILFGPGEKNTLVVAAGYFARRLFTISFTFDLVTKIGGLMIYVQQF